MLSAPVEHARPIPSRLVDFQKALDCLAAFLDHTPGLTSIITHDARGGLSVSGLPEMMELTLCYQVLCDT